MTSLSSQFGNFAITSLASGIPHTQTLSPSHAKTHTPNLTFLPTNSVIPQVLSSKILYKNLYKKKIAKKVKVTLVQALRLCTGRTAHKGSRGIALLFHDHGTRRCEGSASRPGRSLPPEKDQVPIVQEAGWAPGPVWTGAENLASTGIRSPDRPVRSQSLYRLSYPAHLYTVHCIK